MKIACQYGTNTQINKIKAWVPAIFLVWRFSYLTTSMKNPQQTISKNNVRNAIEQLTTLKINWITNQMFEIVSVLYLRHTIISFP